MKKILLSIMAIVTIGSLAIAQDAFAPGRSSAVGEDPNIKIESGNNQATFVTGADNSNTVSYCKNCQHRNNLKLSDSKDIAKPGKTQDSKGSSSTSSGVSGNQ